MKKDRLITILTVLLVLIIAFVVINSRGGNTSKEIAQCIGDKAILYVQNGCSHCITQENMFGENAKYLNIISCSDDWTQCQHIRSTPSWEIDGQIISGTKSIGCPAGFFSFQFL